MKRALDANVLYNLCKNSSKVIKEKVCEVDFNDNSEYSITIVTGSFYFIAELKEKTGI